MNYIMLYSVYQELDLHDGIQVSAIYLQKTCVRVVSRGFMNTQQKQFGSFLRDLV